MKSKRNIRFCSLLILCSLVLLGCGKKDDESKAISEIQAEAEKMDVQQLKSMAMTYKEAIVAKKGDLGKVTAKLEEIKVTEMLGDEAKKLKADIADVTKSVSALKDRFQVYYQKLKEKDGDLSGLEI